MLQYSEQQSSSSTSAIYEHVVARDKLSLSQIWQYLTRTKCLPDGLDLDVFFVAIHEKLNDPEWEVRQHTLRLLRDFIKNVDGSCVSKIFDDLLQNLGHISPAVRKAAADCLRSYLKQNKNADEILKNLFKQIVEERNGVEANVILGVILAVPFLILPNITDETVLYVIQQVIEKVDEEIYREAAIRALIRVRCLVGEEKFRKFLEMSPATMSIETFEELSVGFETEVENQNYNGNKNVWSDFNENLLKDPLMVNENDGVVEDRVILETEIQLNSGPAVTMQLHEQSRQNSFNETTDSEEEIRQNSGIVKVLTDEDEDMQRRTPRRVRFGGEVVKMRTPDSDSNGEEKNERQTKSARSFIPVRVSHKRTTQSEPNSPRKNTKNYKVFVSTPDLRTGSGHVFGPKVIGSRIPRMSNKPIFQSTIKITIDGSAKEEKAPVKTKTDKDNKQNLLSPPAAHQGIEILYNLTQSPQRHKQNDENKTEVIEERKIENTQESKTNFNSFQVCDVDFGADAKERNASFVRVDNCDSENHQTNPIDDIMKELQRQEDVTTRLRALKSLFKILKPSTSLELLEDNFGRLMNLLFSASDQPALKLLAQEILSFLFENIETSILESKLNQITMFLCKMGMPDGVRLAIKLMKRLSIPLFIDHLLSKPILHAKSSKIRESSIQILISICRICPSTEIDAQNVAKSVIFALADRKRKVRQAVLELLAVLAQLTSISVMLETAATETQDHPDRESILCALRNRLSRRQLPAVETNGLIRYSTPIGESELEWLSLGNTGTSSVRQDLYKSEPEQRIGSTTCRSDLGYWQRDDRFRGIGSRRGMEIHSACDFRWSRNSREYDKEQDNRNGIWAIETTPNQSAINTGTLRPIYVLQPNILTANFNKTNNAQATTAEDIDNSSSDSSSRSKSSSPQKTNKLFRKSFSSDSLCGNNKEKTTAQAMSSDCSSTSGSSTRSGTWNREMMRTGIPVPVGAFSRRSFRRSQPKTELGPISFERSKATTPEKHIPKPISFIEHFSSGSESSGYFTPPAEAPTSERATPKQETESFVRIDTPPTPPQKEIDIIATEELSPAKANSTPTPVVEDVEENSYTAEEKPAESLDDVDFERKINRELSKSEADLKRNATKTPRPLKSAPQRNEYVHTPLYHETTINITNVTLPGSVDVTVQSQVKTIEQPPEKKLIKRTLSRKSTKSDVSTEHQIFPKPKETLTEILTQLESNDWEATIRGLKTLTRLKQQNAEALEPQMHNICVALGKQIKNLRSQVARAACTAAAEMFVDHKKSFEMEVEEIAAPLLQRTADTNKFLRSDANAALDVMCATLQPTKVIAIVTSRGCTHQNALVRATAARLLCNLVHKLGVDRVFQMPRETRDKILLAGANMLLDGNLDTRKSAKIMLSHLCKHAHFHKAMIEVVPTCTMRHIQKTLKSLK